MRFLRPAELISLASGLWAIDEFQPVAAILDPRSGAVRDVVNWPQLPPAPTAHGWPQPAVLGDGTSLWAQQHRSGPVVRIDPAGVAQAVWTDGLQLAACGPGEAWCAPAPPDHQLVHGKNAQPRTLVDGGVYRLLRLRTDGRQDAVIIDRPVREVYPTSTALIVRVDDDPGQLRHLGGETYDTVWTSRYLSIPWGVELPERLPVAEHARRERPDDIGSFPTVWSMYWYEPAGDPRGVLHAAGLRWRLGRQMGARTAALNYPILATAHDDTDEVIGRYELGPGTVVAARPIADDTAVGVAVRRAGPTGPVEVLSIAPGKQDVTTLLSADTIDITDRGWPLVPRPIEVDSYAHRILARNSTLETYWTGDDGVQPLVDGMTDVRTTLDGQWPNTHLEWTFRWSERAGLLLRRRVPLYDELGRLHAADHSSIALMEDLATGAVPPASAGQNGTLDI